MARALLKEGNKGGFGGTKRYIADAQTQRRRQNVVDNSGSSFGLMGNRFLGWFCRQQFNSFAARLSACRLGN